MSFTLGNPIAVSTNFIKSNPAVPVYKGTEEPENLFGVIYHIEIGYNENNKEKIKQYIEKLYFVLRILQKNVKITTGKREESKSQILYRCKSVTRIEKHLFLLFFCDTLLCFRFL